MEQVLPVGQTVGPAQPLPAHCPYLDCVETPGAVVVAACEVVVIVVDVVAALDDDDEDVEAPCVDLELEVVLLLFWVDAVDEEEDGAVPWTHCQ